MSETNPLRLDLDSFADKVLDFRKGQTKTSIFLDGVEILIAEVRRLRLNNPDQGKESKEESGMDLLSTTQTVVRALKTLTYEQKIEVLDLARKQFDLQEKAALKAPSAPEQTVNSEGSTIPAQPN